MAEGVDAVCRRYVVCREALVVEEAAADLVGAAVKWVEKSACLSAKPRWFGAGFMVAGTCLAGEKRQGG